MTDIKFPLLKIPTLSSIMLERYVAAIFHSQYYFVNRGLFWSETGQGARVVNILQTDVLAFHFAPFGESKIVVECKGGGAFTDYFKFSGIRNYLKPASAFFISNNSNKFDELHRLGRSEQIIVLKPEDIISRFTNSGAKERIAYWYESNEVLDCLIEKERILKALTLTDFSSEQKAAFGEVKKYNTILSKIWIEPDIRIQANLILRGLNENRDFVRKVWKTQGLSKPPDTENAIAQNILCDSAANVVLKLKIEYIVAAVRCAIAMLLSTETDFLGSIDDSNFKAVVQKMIDSIQIACRLPQFLQFWIYQLGGVLNTNDDEIKEIAKFVNEREDVIQNYFSLLKEIFSILTSTGSFTWALTDRAGVIEFKGVPDAIRGFGIYYRKKHSIDTRSFTFQKQWLSRLKTVTGY